MVPAKKTGTAQGVFQGWLEDEFQGAVGQDEGLPAPVSARSFLPLRPRVLCGRVDPPGCLC